MIRSTVTFQNSQMFWICRIFITVILPTATDAVQCLAKNKIQVPVFPEILPYLEESLDYLKTENKSYCQVNLKVDTEWPELTILFKEVDRNSYLSNLSNIHTKIVSTYEFPNIARDKTDISVSTEIEFICYNTDYCDRFFVLEHSRWLLFVSNDKLIHAIHVVFQPRHSATSKSSNDVYFE